MTRCVLKVMVSQGIFFLEVFFIKGDGVSSYLFLKVFVSQGNSWQIIFLKVISPEAKLTSKIEENHRTWNEIRLRDHPSWDFAVENTLRKNTLRQKYLEIKLP
jgi:hypothetical protein